MCLFPFSEPTSTAVLEFAEFMVLAHHSAEELSQLLMMMKETGRKWEMLEAMESSVTREYEISEEELAVLPRHTKVVVTGNNRTKSVLLGLHGVVKKAVGLGGWHWLVLANGDEVKLQRNALSVIETPSLQEEDDEHNSDDTVSDDMQKTQNSRLSHRILAPAERTRRRAHSFESLNKGPLKLTRCSSKVDLSKLEPTALWRYSRHFNLVGSSLSPSKEQLIDVVQKHFKSQQLDELQVIAGFVQAAKRLKTFCR